MGRDHGLGVGVRKSGGALSVGAPAPVLRQLCCGSGEGWALGCGSSVEVQGRWGLRE